MIYYLMWNHLLFPHDFVLNSALTAGELQGDVIFSSALAVLKVRVTSHVMPSQRSFLLQSRTLAVLRLLISESRALQVALDCC